MSVKSSVQSTVLCIVAICVAVEARASVQEVKLADDAFYWLHNTSSTFWAEDGLTGTRGSSYESGNYSAAWKNSVDVIGGPEFTPSADPTALNSFVKYNKQSGQLLEIGFRYQGKNFPTLPGDLFIDVGDNGFWNYVARTPWVSGSGTNYLTTNRVVGGNTWVLEGGDWDVVYSENGWAYDPGKTTLDADQIRAQYEKAYESYTAQGNNWTNWVIRTDSPWRLTNAAAQAGTLTQNAVAFSGYTVGFSGVEVGDFSTFDLSELGINLFQNGEQLDLRFAFTLNCGNDVIFQSLPGDLQFNPVPEPGSLAIWSLLAAGAATGAGIRRSKRRRVHWSEENRQVIRRIVQGDR